MNYLKVSAWSSTLVVTITVFRPKGISRVLKKLLTYFNGTIISTFFVPILPVWPVIFSVILNKLVIALAPVKSVVVLSAAKIMP